MTRTQALLVLGLAVAALTGCSASKHGSPADPPGLSAEQASVQSAISMAPEIASDGLFDASAPAGFSARPLVGDLSGRRNEGEPEIDPSIPSTDRQWWRTIRDVTRSFEYQFSSPDARGRPTLAHVVVHKRFLGSLHVAWPEVVMSETGSPSVVRRYFEKPLEDRWVRHLWLARVPSAEPGREWRIVAASGVDAGPGTEVAGADTRILSLRVQADGDDAAVSDPASAITWGRLWSVLPGTLVTVTVTTNAPDDVVVLMHESERLPLTANGDNTYSGTWRTAEVHGLKHFGVNALSRATLFDESGGYHSDAWMVPYLPRGESYGD
jgi:hypothetical protein